MRSVSSSSVIRTISVARFRIAGHDRGLAALERLRGRLAQVEPQPLARFASSCPWQAKQFFARIGRTSRLKSTFTLGVGPGSAAGADLRSQPTISARPANARMRWRRKETRGQARSDSGSRRVMRFIGWVSQRCLFGPAVVDWLGDRRVCSLDRPGRLGIHANRLYLLFTIQVLHSRCWTIARAIVTLGVAGDGCRVAGKMLDTRKGRSSALPAVLASGFVSRVSRCPPFWHLASFRAFPRRPDSSRIRMTPLTPESWVRFVRFATVSLGGWVRSADPRTSEHYFWVRSAIFVCVALGSAFCWCPFLGSLPHPEPARLTRHP